MPISLLALLANYRQANGLSIIGTEGSPAARPDPDPAAEELFAALDEEAGEEEQE